MFETSLKSKLVTIFGVPKATFDMVSESREHNCLFISVDRAITWQSFNKATAEVRGSIALYMDSNKLPFGFFMRRLKDADPADHKDLFFFNMDQNEKYFGNLVERSCEFVYFYNAEYNDDFGELTSVTFEDEA